MVTEQNKIFISKKNKVYWSIKPPKKNNLKQINYKKKVQKSNRVCNLQVKQSFLIAMYLIYCLKT